MSLLSDVSKEYVSENCSSKDSTSTYKSYNQAKQDVNDLIAIDYFFAREMLLALKPDKESQLILQALFFSLSASLRSGHSCLVINELSQKQWGSRTLNASEVKSEREAEAVNEPFFFPEASTLHAYLEKLNITKHDNQPVVLEQGKLYLRRYFQFETDLAESINQRLALTSVFDIKTITDCIALIFPCSGKKNQDQTNEIDWQKIAVANAINKNFSVIAGGPGTGKTYTVTKLLAALVMLESSKEKFVDQSSSLNIALVAPTGKAAQRLSESIINAVSAFRDSITPDVLDKIPTSAQTIHRLLGVIPNSPNFRHNQDNLLPYDIILIDEVSMVDLPLMTRVFRSLKEDTKVILLGDADQLPSVAAGSVLADIAPRPHRGFSEKNNAYLAEVCQFPSSTLAQAFEINPLSVTDGNINAPTSDHLTFLLKSRRFDGQGGIGLLASAVIAGNSHDSWQLLQRSVLTSEDSRDDSQLDLVQGSLDSWLAPLVKRYYKPLSECEDAAQAFTLLSKFRVLCATRQGDYGVENLNEKIKLLLGKSVLGNRFSGVPNQSLYHGQPIMISENDYSLGLYNGDIGIIFQVEDQSGGKYLMACFEGDEKVKIREILPSRLPTFETVYAMTIHKTQGSEFAHVAMAISSDEGTQKGSRLLSRELLYTGITRAKVKLTIACNQNIWQQGVHAQVKRNSGLMITSER